MMHAKKEAPSNKKKYTFQQHWCTYLIINCAFLLPVLLKESTIKTEIRRNCRLFFSFISLCTENPQKSYPHAFSPAWRGNFPACFPSPWKNRRETALPFVQYKVCRNNKNLSKCACAILPNTRRGALGRFFIQWCRACRASHLFNNKLRFSAPCPADYRISSGTLSHVPYAGFFGRLISDLLKRKTGQFLFWL